MALLGTPDWISGRAFRSELVSLCCPIVVVCDRVENTSALPPLYYMYSATQSIGQFLETPMDSKPLRFGQYFTPNHHINPITLYNIS